MIFNHKLISFLKNEYYPSAWLGNIEFAMWLVDKYQPGITVELGIDYGHSLFSLASNNSGYVFGIDNFRGDIFTGNRFTYIIVYETYWKFLQTKMLSKDNILIVKDTFDEAYKDFGKKIDLLHIDGLHTYEAVKNDYDKWSKKVNDDGIVILHDCITFPETVGRLYQEIEFPKTLLNNRTGLGIVCKNKSIIDEINNLWIDKLIYSDNYNTHPDFPELTITK